MLSLNYRVVVAGLLMALLAGAVSAQTQAPAQEEKTWTINFKDSDIQEVIKFVADATGRTLVIDPRVKGRVQVISARPMNADELYTLFLSLLNIHGFSAIESKGITQIIPVKNARTAPTQVSELDADPSGQAQVTKVIQLKNIAAVKIVPVIRPLAPQHAHVAAYDPSNALIVTDTPQNIRRIQEIIERLDRSAVAETELVPLNYAQAEEVVKIIEKLNLPGSDKSNAVTQLKLVADVRSNGILVSGDDMQRKRIKDLIERLDFPSPQGGNVRVVYLEYAEAKQVAGVLSNVLQGMAKLKGADQNAANKSTVEADEDTNSLLITADVEVLQSLLAVIKRLDIRRAQVLVEAIVAEVTDNGDEELGIQWLFQDAESGFGVSGAASESTRGLLGGAADFFVGDGEIGDLITSLGGLPGQTFGIADSGRNNDFVVLLRALQQNTDVNILSTPNILTMDNHEAEISVGENVPFVTGSFSSTGNNSNPSNPFQTIQRENVGISLKVTPQVNEGDSIVLDIVQEVSSINSSPGVSAADIITRERKITTQVLAEDGEIVVLGGLISDNVTMNEQRVPLLGSIPVLGHLFRSESNTIEKRNLMVFIRAKVIRDAETLSGATAQKYRHIREQQEKSREQTGIMIRGRELPILPEWQEPVRTPETDAANNSEEGAGEG